MDRGQITQLVCHPWCSFCGCHGHTESHSGKLKVHPSLRWQWQIAVYVHGKESCPPSAFCCKDPDVLICATLDPLRLTGSFFLFRSTHIGILKRTLKGHLLPNSRPYSSFHSLHFPCVSCLLQRLELLTGVLHQCTKWSRHLSWKPNKINK